MYTQESKRKVLGYEVVIKQTSNYEIPWTRDKSKRPADYYEKIATSITFMEADKKIEITIPMADPASGKDANRMRMLKIKVDGKEYQDSAGLGVLDMNQTFDLPEMQRLINWVITHPDVREGPIKRSCLPFFYLPAAHYMAPHEKQKATGVDGGIEETHGNFSQLIAPYVEAMASQKGIKREIYIPVVTYGGPHHWNVCIISIDEKDKPSLTYLESTNSGFNVADVYFNFYRLEILPKLNEVLKTRGYPEINEKDIIFDVSKQFSREGCGITASINMLHLLDGSKSIAGNRLEEFPRLRKKEIIPHYSAVSIEEDALLRTLLALKLTQHEKIIGDLEKENPQYIKHHRYSHEKMLRELTTHPHSLKARAEEIFPPASPKHSGFKGSLESFSPLKSHINALNEYGQKLSKKKKDRSKIEGEKTCHLAQELTILVDKYINALKSGEVMQAKKLSGLFKQALTNGYKAMETHRKPWKVIMGNIAIAATGVGLLVILGKYLATGSAFFGKTHRQKQVEEIKNEAEIIKSIFP